jgi:hypothetical protein
MPRNSKSTARKSSSGEVVIPDKLYFRIGEVSRLCRLPSYVLRFWETEFPQLKPSKSNTGQGFTIAGARQYLRSEGRKKQSSLPFSGAANVGQIKQVRQGLKEILGLLSGRK